MLAIACANIWNYLIRKRMYKSYPMTLAYSILVIYCVIGIIYEVYMGIECGDHDCIMAIKAFDYYHENDLAYPDHYYEISQQIF